MSKTQYQPEAGTEDLVHVSVSKKNGQPIDPPKIEHYSAAMWPSVSKLPGFEAEVVHPAGGAKQKVSASTVKPEKELSSDEQYVERYKLLFRSQLPDELVGNPDRIKQIVDRADATLSQYRNDEEVVPERVFEEAPALNLDTTQPITEAETTEPAPVKSKK